MIGSLDEAVFRFVHEGLSNPVLDAVLPLFTGNRLVVPAVAAAAVWLAWRWRVRGVVAAALIAAAVGVSDGAVCGPLKKAVGRHRPAPTRQNPAPAGPTDPTSMPSSHAANAFAAAGVAFFFFRRSGAVLFPLACLVCLSRVYVGDHYPADVAAGALLGLGTAAGVLAGAEALWRRAGARWLPLWHGRLPSLLRAGREAGPAGAADGALEELQWLRLGYALTAAMLALRLGILAGAGLELGADEAVAWHASKRLALSHVGSPPLTAVATLLGTSLFGDTAFGVRFLSPVMAAGVSILILHLMAREKAARQGFVWALAAATTPLLMAASLRMTADALSTLFCTAAMCSAWRALREDSATGWAWTGLWGGLGLLSGPAALAQGIGLALFLAAWPPARVRLRKPGPWLALGVSVRGALPVLVWNAARGWPAAGQLLGLAGPGGPGSRGVSGLLSFAGSGILLLHPIFLVGIVGAALGIRRRRPADPLMIYLLCAGLPPALVAGAAGLGGGALPERLAPAALPLLGLAARYWDERRREGVRAATPLLLAGSALALGVMMAVLSPTTQRMIAGRNLPPELDLTRRFRGWTATAQAVESARERLEAEGRPAFVIGEDGGLAGLLAFHSPEVGAGFPRNPRVFGLTRAEPASPFDLWPGYRGRSGESAVFVREAERAGPVPAALLEEFESLNDLGVREVALRGGAVRRIQLVECRGLR